jgi:hypothetical protein
MRQTEKKWLAIPAPFPGKIAAESVPYACAIVQEQLLSCAMNSLRNSQNISFVASASLRDDTFASSLSLSEDEVLYLHADHFIRTTSQ